jgi:hypothetical protein
MALQRREGLAQPGRSPAHTVDAQVARVRHVPQPQLDGVEAELRGELVDQGLDRERARRSARRAVRARAEPIRAHGVRLDAERAKRVHAADLSACKRRR